MAKFDVSKYKPVKDRKKRFLTDYPDGRMVPENISTNIMEYALFVTRIYKNVEDQAAGLPLAQGYAHEIRETALSINSYGKEYESVNYTSWVENCEESSVGRALDNAGYASKCSREEIDKVNRILADPEMEKRQAAHEEAQTSKARKKAMDMLTSVEALHGKDVRVDYEEQILDAKGYDDIVAIGKEMRKSLDEESGIKTTKRELADKAQPEIF